MPSHRGLAPTIGSRRRHGHGAQRDPATSPEAGDVPATSGPGGAPKRWTEALPSPGPLASRHKVFADAPAGSGGVAALIPRHIATPRHLFIVAEGPHGRTRSLQG